MACVSIPREWRRWATRGGQLALGIPFTFLNPRWGRCDLSAVRREGGGTHPRDAEIPDGPLLSLTRWLWTVGCPSWCPNPQMHLLPFPLRGRFEELRKRRKSQFPVSFSPVFLLVHLSSLFICLCPLSTEEQVELLHPMASFFLAAPRPGGQPSFVPLLWGSAGSFTSRP